MSDTLVIKWAWRYGQLQGDDFESLDEAVRMASYAIDASDESLHSFEVWDKDGYRLIPENEADKLVYAYWRASQSQSTPKPVVAHVCITDPEGKTLSEDYSSVEEAQAEVDRLKPFLGDRVYLETPA